MRELLRRLTRTPDEIALTVVRLTLAVTMFPHGAQKTFGWWGGNGFAATYGAFTTKMGIPPVFALAAILTESLGAVFMALGLFGRLTGLAYIVLMAVAVFTTPHLSNGFFMNWSGKQAGEGFEYHLLMAGAALAVALRGAGALSLDRAIHRRLSGESAEAREAAGASTPAHA
jgi:putative oxidoreductase